MNTVNSGESMYAVPVGGNDLEVSVNHGNTWTLSPSVININDTTFSTIAGSADTTRMIVGSEVRPLLESSTCVLTLSIAWYLSHSRLWCIMDIFNTIK